MALLRGRGRGVEIVLAERDVEEALAELEARLNERAAFYRGTSATAAFGSIMPTHEQLDRLGSILAAAHVTFDGVSGAPPLEVIASARGLRFVSHATQADAGQELARRRAMRPKREVQLSEAAKSLVADFAGARTDIAQRRKRGEGSVRRLSSAELAPPAPARPVVAEGPSTLYHTGTLRGGQSLHNVGTIVVVGDVNPGAELVATGDVVVFGALRGVAHAGAQGDIGARVYALELAPTQLRIATFIAADAKPRKRSRVEPEVALVQSDRIAIVSYTSLDQLSMEGPH
jgi:septum site-determining protein MinC